MYIRITNRNIASKKGGKEKESSEQTYQVMVSKEMKNGIFSILVKVAQSCPTLCDPMDYMVHGILQARILEWVAFPFSRGSSQPRDQTQVSRITGGFFISWAKREAQEYWSG